jgi:threonine/homoserine/homoserine lactone efflux protein
MPHNLTLEIILKILITNAIWIPLHFGWLYAGTLLHELNLSPRTQRTINILMAISMLMVVFLAAAFAQGRAG